jgi:hypothetical protein
MPAAPVRLADIDPSFFGPPPDGGGGGGLYESPTNGAAGGDKQGRGGAPSASGGAAAPGAAGAGAGGGAPGAADWEDHAVTDLLEPPPGRQRSVQSGSDLGGGLKIGPNVGAELVRGISSVGTVISNEKTAAVIRMLEESVKK